jgi:hypothetical protein
MMVVSTNFSISTGFSATAACCGFTFPAAGFVAALVVRRTCDFAFGFAVACFAAFLVAVFLLAGLTLAFARFALFLRAAARFFLLASAISFQARPLRALSPVRSAEAVLI